MRIQNEAIRLTTGMTLLLACAAGALRTVAQTNTETRQPSVGYSEVHHIKATVEDIDYDKREVTLKGPRGNTAKYAVSDAVKNFPQMKKGDQVNIGYYESVVLALRKPGDELSPTSRSESLATRKPGQKPGAVAVATSDITAAVEDIDRDKREVTLKGPEGNSVKVVVDPSVGNLERIKEGDQITATRTEALAISVEAPDSEPAAKDTKPDPK